MISLHYSSINPYPSGRQIISSAGPLRVEYSLQPNSPYHLPVNVSEGARAVRQVVVELPTEILPIGQIQGAFSIFQVIFEVAFILHPAGSYFVEVFPVDCRSYVNWILIVENTIAV